MPDIKKVETTHLVVGGAILIIILLVGAMIFMRNRVESDIVGGNTDNTPATSTPQAVGDINVTVADQDAGQSVMVVYTDLPEGAWIAIKESDSTRILGAGRFPLGGTASGAIPLLRATEAGKSYQAVVYTDDGDRVFDMKKDVVVEGASASFTAK